ncbi:MAG: response regulator transcription factor [bacterium]
MKAYKDVPILIMSALNEKIDRMRGFDAGADDYLEKPFGEEELQQKVQGLLRDVG